MAYSGYRGHPHVLRAVAENLASFLDAEIDPDRQLILTRERRPVCSAHYRR